MTNKPDDKLVPKATEETPAQPFAKEIPEKKMIYC